jgi:hypothetical protein
MAPTRYEIRLLGRVEPDASAAFADLDVELGDEVTCLRGTLDEAGLRSVLERVEARGLTLVEVRSLK